MRKPPVVRDIDEQREDFKRTRARLAEYIGLLTLAFGEFGLTVYEILSKSIASSHRLEPIPGEILDKTDISPRFLNTRGIA